MKTEIENEFVEACTMHSDALFRYCYFKIADRDMAKDLVQETFMKTWSYLGRGEKIDNIRAFFYKTLSNLIIDEYRKKKTLSLDGMEENGFDIGASNEETLLDKFDAEYALLSLNQIGESYKDVIMMRYVDDLSLKEISKITGEPENTVAVKIHRGLKKVKEIFRKKQDK